jgi:hypothetical protein
LAVFRGSEYFGVFVIFPLQDARARGWCWRIKKGIAIALSPENGKKKGKGTPYQTEALLPVIFSNVIVVAIYPLKVRLPLINRGVF